MLAAIMVVAALLRFYDYGGWSLSNDELSALSRLQFSHFLEMIRQGARIDGHPAGVQAFLWWWTGWFGDGVWVVRLPFVIFGILSVYFVYLIGRRWFGVSTGLFAAAAMAFLQYPVLYSQIARPYSPGLLFPLIGIYFWTRIVFDPNRRLWHYPAFALATALALYSHHFSFLLMLIVGATGFIFWHRLDLRRYLLAAFLVFVLYAPHLEIFFHQLGLGGVGGPGGWLAKPGPGWIVGYLHYAFNESWAIVAVMALFVVVPPFFIRPRLSVFHLIALLWFIAVFFTGYLYSVYVNPVLQYSLLLFVFPFLLLLIFSLLPQKIGKGMQILLLIFLAAGTVHTVFVYRYFNRQHFGEFRDVAYKIAAWNSRLGPENVTNTVVVNAPYYIHYYLDDSLPGIRFAQYDNHGQKDLLALARIVRNSRTPYFVHGWTKPEPAGIDMIIREKYPCLLAHFDYGGLSAVSLYGRNTADSCIPQHTPLLVFENGFETNNLWNGNPKQRDSSRAMAGKYSYRLDKDIEYGPGLTFDTANLHRDLFRVGKIRVTLSAFAPDTLQKVLMVATVENPETGTRAWRGMNIADLVDPKQWQQAPFEFDVPVISDPADRIKVYLWNPERETVWIDNYTIRLYPRK